MAVVRWRPVMRELLNFQDEFNRMVDEFFGRWPSLRGETGTLWVPAMDVYETDEGIVVKAELPGVRKEDLKISVDNNILTIRAEKKQDAPKDVSCYYCSERVFGTFQRSFTLPNTADATRVKATYRDGVLVIEIPKKEEARPKEIQVEVE
ncbi:MAG: Hsp20/alpha crystallin family protein [candidate division KSB1 bacterium]|nr:Hsp20/alpha crystallin family protein [candidate division KSB1 bacterium]